MMPCLPSHSSRQPNRARGPSIPAAAETYEGICYIETMNLDGETNLKIKKSLDETKGLVEATVGGLVGCVRCEPPNCKLYQFTGAGRAGAGVAAACGACRSGDACDRHSAGSPPATQLPWLACASAATPCSCLPPALPSAQLVLPLLHRQPGAVGLRPASAGRPERRDQHRQQGVR
jgi:hypothetical protein